jgi:two-component system response regulator HydG
VLLDIRMPGMDGLETLVNLRQLAPSLPVVMMTAYADVPTAVAAMKAGAEDYVTKPFFPDEITALLRRLAQRHLEPPDLKATLAPGSESWSYDDFAGRSATMARAVDLARKAAQTDASVLLRGERGLGKECLARAIHAAGRRRLGPFVAVHCAGLSEGVLEAELFGYARGALPGSPLAKRGRLEMADQGTLYLDEVAGLGQRLQLALLHSLEDRAVARLGGETRRAVDVRVMACSSEDVVARSQDGTFLPALLARLGTVVLDVQPLRERPEDIPHLVERMIRRGRVELGKNVSGVSAEALAALVREPWPGNVRQLARVIDRAIVACSGDVIGPEHLVFA